MKRFIFFVVYFAIGVNYALALYIDGFYYSVDVPNLTMKVVGCEIPNSGDVVIPGTVNYEGREFTVISVDGFRESSVRSVVIPNTVSRIAKYAFFDCKELSSVTMPDRSVEIGEYAFSGCDNLIAITLQGLVSPHAFKGAGLKNIIFDAVEIQDPDEPNQSSPFEECSGVENVFVRRGISYKKSTQSIYKDRSPIKLFPDAHLKELYISSGAQRMFSGCFRKTEIDLLTIEPYADMTYDGGFDRNWISDAIIGKIIIQDSEYPLRWSSSSSVSNTDYSPRGVNSLYLGRNLIAFYNYRKDFLAEYLAGNQTGSSVGSFAPITSEITFGEQFSGFDQVSFYSSPRPSIIRTLNRTPIPFSPYTFTSDAYLYSQVFVPEGTLEAYKNTDGWKLFFNISEETSDVEEISVATPQKNRVRYNIMGQPVDENYKGLVIENGKKMIVK